MTREGVRDFKRFILKLILVGFNTNQILLDFHFFVVDFEGGLRLGNVLGDISMFAL